MPKIKTMYFDTNTIWRNLYSTKQKQGLAIKRLGLEILDIDGKKVLNKLDYIDLLQNRFTSIKTHEGKQEITQRLQDLGVTATARLTTTTKVSKVKKSLRPSKKSLELLWHQRWSIATIKFLQTVADFVQSKPIVFIALVGVMAIQCRHLAYLVNKVGQNDGVLIGYAFSMFAESCALLIVLHGGSKKILLGFAFFQFWTNCLYYIEMPIIITKITLSAFIAFCLYSFSELYTKTNIRK